MDFDANVLLASMLPSSIGLVMFIYGKRQARVPHMAVGVVLMVYPYFVSNILLMFGIAAVLCLGLWLAVRRGL
jgi:hypothetical protein